MILKSIKLRNIRSYTNETIEFPEGSVMLAGDIGSGKSTILLAVEFALFGIRRPELVGEGLLRNGKKDGEVELRFAIDGKEVIIKRSLQRAKTGVGQSSGYIIVDGIKTEGTAVELKSRILNLLGYPEELLTKSKSLIYRYTVYTPQDDMKAILMDDKDTRLDTLRRVFGIDKYKRIRENATLYIRDLKNQIKALDLQASDYEQIKTQIKEKDSEIKSMKENLTILNDKIGIIRKKYNSLKEKSEDLEKEQKKLALLKNDFNVNEAKLFEKAHQQLKLKSEIERNGAELILFTKKYDELPEIPDKIDDEITEQEKLLNDIQQNTAILTEKISNDHKRKQELQNSLKDKQKELELRTKYLDELRKLDTELKKKDEILAGIGKSEASIRESELSGRELEIIAEQSKDTIGKITKIDVCPLCRQTVDKDHKHRIIDFEQGKAEKASESLEKLRKKKDSEYERLEQLKLEQKRLEALESRAEVLKIKTEKDTAKDIAELEKSLARLNAHIADNDKELNTLRKTNLADLAKGLNNSKLLSKKLQEKRNLIQLIEERRDRQSMAEKEQARLKKEIGIINELKISLKKQLSEFKDIEIAYEKNKEEFLKAQNELHTKELDKASMDKELEGIGKMLMLLESELQKKEKLRKQAEYSKQMRHWLEEFFIGLMGNMEKHIMMQLYTEFNEYFQNWFDMLIEDEAFSVRLDEEFTPIVEQNGYETDITALSGGEKTSLALAYRLALNKVINDFISTIKTRDLIILDEPTDGFSTEQLDKVRDVLNQLNAKQIIIVSHESKIESFVQNIIRIHKEEHVSKIY